MVPANSLTFAKRGECESFVEISDHVIDCEEPLPVSVGGWLRCCCADL
jgi:hypothetical protein